MKAKIVSLRKVVKLSIEGTFFLAKKTQDFYLKKLYNLSTIRFTEFLETQLRCLGSIHQKADRVTIHSSIRRISVKLILLRICFVGFILKRLRLDSKT